MRWKDNFFNCQYAIIIAIRTKREAFIWKTNLKKNFYELKEYIIGSIHEIAA